MLQITPSNQTSTESTDRNGQSGEGIRNTVAAEGTVKVYTRHNRGCPKRDRPGWARCNCVKWLYIHHNGKDKRVSAKTRSWESAVRRAGELRDSLDPIKLLQRQLEAKVQQKSGVRVDFAVSLFLKEGERLGRADATRSKYKLTLDRMSAWCAAQKPALWTLAELDVPTLRSWIQSWTGAANTRHNQHQRLRTFFRFCMDQGWISENPAKKIPNITPDQEQKVPFTREQYKALIKATYYYDSRGNERNGETTNSRRVRAYLKLLRWSGLRAGDGACLGKDRLREDGSLLLYQAKVKKKSSASVYVLLPPEIADELRQAPPSSWTHPDYFFWSGGSKRKSEVSNWGKIFSKVVSKATELFPKLFLDTNGKPKPAHLHMMRHTFAVEYLLAGMLLEDVSRLLGHSSVTVTQKHYTAWVLERQQRLAASQRTAWRTMGTEERPHAPRRRRRHRSQDGFQARSVRKAKTRCYGLNPT